VTYKLDGELDPIYFANQQHWMTAVPLDYLKEGDRFALMSNGVLAKVATGVADMDGHSVSETYGFRSGNDYYTSNHQKSYINVRWDSIEYCKKGSFNFKIPLNHSLYNKDGVVYVNKEIAERVKLDQQQNAGIAAETTEQKTREAKKAELLAQVATIEKQIREL
jgi:hypothetical protein